MVRPVPIPNTAVKRSLADGSGFIDSARVGRRQSFLKSRNENRFGFFIEAGNSSKTSPSTFRRANVDRLRPSLADALDQLVRPECLRPLHRRLKLIFCLPKGRTTESNIAHGFGRMFPSFLRYFTPSTSDDLPTNPHVSSKNALSQVIFPSSSLYRTQSVNEAVNIFSRVGCS